MTDVLLSKTVKLALLFAALGVTLIVGDAAYFQLTDDHFSYVIEFYGLLGTLFAGVAAKNFGDNVLSYRERTVNLEMGQVPPNAPPQPVV